MRRLLSFLLVLIFVGAEAQAQPVAGFNGLLDTLKTLPSWATTPVPVTTAIGLTGHADLALWGAVMNGTNDDSCAVQAAVNSLSGTGIGIYISPGEQVTMGGACYNIPLANVNFFGARISDNNYPYGVHGSQIHITDTVNSPFKIAGNNVIFDGIDFFWPNQIENLAGPIAYPCAFTDLGTGTHNNWSFAYDQVTNAYDFFCATSNFGWMYVGPNNHMLAFDAVFTLQENPAENYVFNDDFSTGVYGSELHHYGNTGAGAAGIISIATPGAASGVSVIPVSTTTGINVNAVVSGNSCIPNGSYVGSIGTGNFTLYQPAASGSNAGPVTTTCAIAAGNLRFDTYALLNYMASNASVFKITGNGTVSQGCTNCGAGGGALQWSNSYIHGFENGILAQGAYFNLTNLVNISFEVEHPINIQNSEFIEIQVIGGVGYFGYKGYPNLSNCNRGGAFLIQNPSPANGSDNYNRLSVIGERIPFMEGPVLQASGSNINLLNFLGNDFKNWQRFGSCPGQYLATVTGPNATVKWNENHTFASTGTLNGIQLLAVYKAQIENNFLGDPGNALGKAIDIETSTGSVTVGGNSVFTTGNTPSSPDMISGTATPPYTFGLNGTVNANGGDVVTLTATGSFPGSPTSTSYTTVPGDGLGSTHTQFLTAIEGNSTLASAGLIAGGGSTPFNFALYNTGAYTVTWTVSHTGGVNVTTPVAGSSLAGANLWDLGNTWTVPNYVYLPSGHQIFTSSQTITMPVHANHVEIKLWGEGGKGGNGVACASGTAMSAGAGGGAGEFLDKIFAAADLPATVALTVPTAADSPTIFGTLLQANAGGAGANGQCGANAAGGGGAGIRGGGGDASGATAGTGGVTNGAAGGTTGAGTANTIPGLGTGGSASVSGSAGVIGTAGIVSNGAGGSSASGLAATPVSTNGVAGGNAGYSLAGLNTTAGSASNTGVNNGDGGAGSNLASDEPGGSGGSGASFALTTGRAGNAGASGNTAGGSGGGSCLTGCTPGLGASGGPAGASLNW